MPLSPVDKRLDLGAVLVQRDDAAFLRERVVAAECGLRSGVLDRRAHLERGRRPRAIALRVHRRIEGCLVDADAPAARDVGGEVEREAERVVERERGRAVEHLAAALRKAIECGAEDLHAVLERLAEALLLGLQHLRNALLLARQLRVRRAHLRVEVVDELVEERLLLPELVAMADRATDDPPQHVAAPVARRDHAVDDQERARADVIGDDLERGIVEIGRAGLARRGLDERDEEVDLVVRVHVLQHGCETLEAHACVDARLGQRRHRELALTHSSAGRTA